jgi:predicted ATPase
MHRNILPIRTENLRRFSPENNSSRNSDDHPFSHPFEFERAGNRFAFCEKFSQFLIQLSLEIPLVLFFDNIDRGDEGTRTFIDYLCKKIQYSRIAVVLTAEQFPSSDEYAQHPFPGLSRHSKSSSGTDHHRISHLDLKGLNREAIT